MAWIVAAVLLLILVWQISGYKRLARKLNSLNEYTQFLLFHPNVYADHRTKFFGFLKSIENEDFTKKAMMSYQAIEDMAAKVEEASTLTNAVKREDPDDELSSF